MRVKTMNVSSIRDGLSCLIEIVELKIERIVARQNSNVGTVEEFLLAISATQTRNRLVVFGAAKAVSSVVLPL